MTGTITPPASDASPSRTAASRMTAAAALLLLVGWMLLLRHIGRGDIYRYLGPYALFVLLACTTLPRFFRVDVPADDAPGTQLGGGLAAGVGVGVVMTLGTYLAYALVSKYVPSVVPHVHDLYAAARTETMFVAIVWTAVVLVAEELLWRSLVLGELERHLPRAAAGLVSVATYVLVEFGSGSWVLALAAFVCGSIWTAERLLTRSLVASIVSHAIWTIVVIHVFPVTSSG